MKYQQIVQAEFLERPNRFVAYVALEGRREKVHVKNTGRCQELLREGAKVWLCRSAHSGRATDYDLVAVEKNGQVVNIDSQAPNKVVKEWLMERTLFPKLVFVRPETGYGSSRFDFYVETEDEKIFIEVKGVTLEEDGVALFPDAPSERAVKHVEELIRARQEGFRAVVLFVIQMTGVEYLAPNRRTHAAFADALSKAAEAGVEILAYDCAVTEDSLAIGKQVPVRLTEGSSDTRNPASACVTEDGLAMEKPVPVRLTDGSSDTRKPASACVTEDGLAMEKPVSVRVAEGSGEKLRETFGNSKEKLRFGDLAALPKPLLNWYDRNRRILPWREEPTPYRVWVSEIMLQQTRVEAVKPYFERFMQRLPDIPSLAAADEDTLLKLWEGLGYYNRVRNLQKAAVRIMEDCGGEMPAEYEELIKLPGIGSYTAGAISSIAYGRVQPAVDGNVLRVISRICMDARLISEEKVKKSVEADLRKVMPTDRPGDFNQAMMEIGACVCGPNGAPHCGECPLRAFCKAHAGGVELEYPKKAAAKKRVIEQKTILVIRDAERTVVRKRGGKGMLAGMYEFPSLEGFRTAEEVVEYLAGSGLRTIRIQPLEDAKHIFSHREWHMRGYMVRVDELEPYKPSEKTEDWIYIQPEETRENYPIPAAFGAYTKVLSMRLGKDRFGEEET